MMNFCMTVIHCFMPNSSLEKQLMPLLSAQLGYSVTTHIFKTLLGCCVDVTPDLACCKK